MTPLLELLRQACAPLARKWSLSTSEPRSKLSFAPALSRFLETIYQSPGPVQAANKEQLHGIFLLLFLCCYPD